MGHVQSQDGGPPPGRSTRDSREGAPAEAEALPKPSAPASQAVCETLRRGGGGGARPGDPSRTGLSHLTSHWSRPPPWAAVADAGVGVWGRRLTAGVRPCGREGNLQDREASPPPHDRDRPPPRWSTTDDQDRQDRQDRRPRQAKTTGQDNRHTTVTAPTASPPPGPPPRRVSWATGWVWGRDRAVCQCEA